MTPVDPFARPDLPDTGPVGPATGTTGTGAGAGAPAERFDFFHPPVPQQGGAVPAAPADPSAHVVPQQGGPRVDLEGTGGREAVAGPETVAGAREASAGAREAFAGREAVAAGPLPAWHDAYREVLPQGIAARAAQGATHSAPHSAPHGFTSAVTGAHTVGQAPGAGGVIGLDHPSAVPGDAFVPSGVGVPARGAVPPVAADDPPTLDLGDPALIARAHGPAAEGPVSPASPVGPASPAGPGAEPSRPAGIPSPAESPADHGGAEAGPLFVVGDVHGYLEPLLTALRNAGIINEQGSWIAGRARIWFLGDFTDRGPDGIGVIDLVMRLAAEAAAAGGYCRALMGNHELLLLGAARFRDAAVQSTAGTASFMAAWRLNGGQQHDLDRLEDHHTAWLSRLPAAVVEDDHLLLHSDTSAYLDFGASVDEVNDSVHELLRRADVDEWWECFRRFTKRFAFRGEDGPAACRELLDTYGGRRIVHGHSPIPYLLGTPGEVDREDAHAAAAQVSGPYVYADKLAVAMDGGVTMDGPMLIARLPLD